MHLACCPETPAAARHGMASRGRPFVRGESLRAGPAFGPSGQRDSGKSNFFSSPSEPGKPFVRPGKPKPRGFFGFYGTAKSTGFIKTRHHGLGFALVEGALTSKTWPSAGKNGQRRIIFPNG